MVKVVLVKILVSIIHELFEEGMSNFSEDI